MSIENKLKAPEGKFVVCVWDPYPRMDIPDPTIVGEPYDAEEEARKYASEMNRKWYEDNKKKNGKLAPEEVMTLMVNSFAGRPLAREIEREYFVIDDRGLRVD